MRGFLVGWTVVAVTMLMTMMVMSVLMSLSASPHTMAFLYQVIATSSLCTVLGLVGLVVSVLREA